MSSPSENNNSMHKKYLPTEKETHDWFEQIPDTITNPEKLDPKTFGVDPTYIKNDVPANDTLNPKYVVAPWLSSSWDPDKDLNSLAKGRDGWTVCWWNERK